MLPLAVLIAAVAGLMVWRDVRPLLERMVSLAERWYVLAPEAPDALGANDSSLGPLPPDIEALALAESEEWARESVRERARELYRACGNDWDQAKQVLYTERQLTIFGGSEPAGGN
jgi:hypothetical protein